MTEISKHVDGRAPFSLLFDRQRAEQWAADLQIAAPFLGVRVDLAVLVKEGEAADLALPGAARRYLTERERERFAGLASPKRRREWLGGRMAAKAAVIMLRSAVLSVEEDGWQQVEIGNDADGRPYVLGGLGSRVCISISHSGGAACALAAPVPCGIDIQAVTGSIGRVRRRFLLRHEEEMADGLAAGAGFDLEYGLTMLWAAKEALRKAATGRPLPGFLQMSLAGPAENRQGRLSMAFEIRTEERQEVQKVAAVPQGSGMICAFAVGGGRAL